MESKHELSKPSKQQLVVCYIIWKTSEVIKKPNPTKRLETGRNLSSSYKSGRKKKKKVPLKNLFSSLSWLPEILNHRVPRKHACASFRSAWFNTLSSGKSPTDFHALLPKQGLSKDCRTQSIRFKNTLCTFEEDNLSLLIHPVPSRTWHWQRFRY